MPKRLLRGVIDYGSGLTQEALAANFQRLQASPIEWVQPADEKIFRFVREFFDAGGDVPTAAVMADFFHRRDDVEVVERLKDIKEAAPSDGHGFKFFLQEVLEEQRRAKLVTLAKQSVEISKKGLVLGEGRNAVRIPQGVVL